MICSASSPKPNPIGQLLLMLSWLILHSLVLLLSSGVIECPPSSWDLSSGNTSQAAGCIFCESEGPPWSFYFHWHSSLYPCMEHLQMMGDMYLHPFIGEGNSIHDWFSSLHTYCRGAQTHASQGGTHESSHSVLPSQAKPSQIYDHAC